MQKWQNVPITEALWRSSERLQGPTVKKFLKEQKNKKSNFFCFLSSTWAVANFFL
jgi:hypothetical protein